MKLLRVLQEREFERIGDTHTTKVDVRVIAATNSDLRRMVADGTFREDLFYRLNVIPVQIPPLRERKEDIPPLVQHFLDKFRPDAAGGPRSPIMVSQEAMRHLMQYPVARQRPPTRTCDRARSCIHRWTFADQSAGFAARDPAVPGRHAGGGRRASGKRARPRRVHGAHRKRTHPAVARAHRREQRKSREAPQPQTYDPRRETEATVDSTIGACRHATRSGQS